MTRHEKQIRDEVSDRDVRMRELEYFRNLRMLPGVWTVIRVDGRNFTRYCGERFTRPQGLYAYTMSDEISLLLPREWDLFDRRLEKVVSISAGIASAAFTAAAGEPAHFDSRVWVGTDDSLVVDYFSWRQDEAAHNALHSWCYWTLRKSGASMADATETLRGKGTPFQNELLFRHGINFNDLPLWQKRGVGIGWEEYEKQGVDPRDDRQTSARRRRPFVKRELPMKEEYRLFLQQVMDM